MWILSVAYYMAVFCLTVGASLTLGLLSFGGTLILPLTPIILFAIGALLLAVAYEGQIYLQNITAALQKLGAKFNVRRRQLAKDYLLAFFPENLNAPDTPEFFRTYQSYVNAAEACLNEDERKEIEKRLNHFEKWFSLQLFPPPGVADLTENEAAVREWIRAPKPTSDDPDRAALQASLRDHHQALKKRTWVSHLAKFFSVLAVVSMSIGTAYLLVETMAMLAIFSSIPLGGIIPLAIVAGLAYGLLIYNTLIDMYTNRTVIRCFDYVKRAFSAERSIADVVMAVLVICLSLLAVALTFCTAGTWWTVVRNAKPLFRWMINIPLMLLAGFVAIINGFAALMFNLQNTGESCQIILEFVKHPLKKFYEACTNLVKDIRECYQKESILQFINPFRFTLKIALSVLRILLFPGHLISIAATADRVPGVSALFSIIIGFINEFFEDFHYFFGHVTKKNIDLNKANREARLGQEAGHSHGDIPTIAIKLCLLPLYVLAAMWSYATANEPKRFSSFKVAAVTFKDAFLNLWRDHDHHHGHEHGHHHHHHEHDAEAQPAAQSAVPEISFEWQRDEILYTLRRQEERLKGSYFDRNGVVKRKQEALQACQEKVFKAKSPEEIIEALRQEIQNPVYTEHRFLKGVKSMENKERLEKSYNHMVSAPMMTPMAAVAG